MIQTYFERFMAKVIILENGCWLWTGTKSGKGYGKMRLSVNQRRQMVLAHRFSYEHFISKIEDGKVIDHLCRNRSCVNPHHLEPVTNRQNILRGIGFAAINAAKTHCPQGHEYTPENTYLWRHGGRICRTCRWLRAIRRRSQEVNVRKIK